eukprot:CAMPEP_0206547046 /NCGR_PEP_ID=MMETSP0325_2-20121206/13074_1 /ASSEMBLY_ACC=CAM_ASM_000347 /TAXON_ID=2866 /ORGANISM="Crypthecodinium cohnii, Strain Seligo" /LENGTH=45 /DNA_ID= /DNA_START= /DNA_END= /DNA_ORIENTATION=
MTETANSEQVEAMRAASKEADMEQEVACLLVVVKPQKHWLQRPSS